jgi:hypothetical protein
MILESIKGATFVKLVLYLPTEGTKTFNDVANVTMTAHGTLEFTSVPIGTNKKMRYTTTLPYLLEQPING